MFSGKSKVVRHIDEDQWLSKRRAAPDAFVANPGDKHLSVHSLELESKRAIVERYRNERQKGRGTVRISIQTIYKYNAASEDTPGAVTYDAIKGEWTFVERDTSAPAYRHSPTPTCNSHCGVEYIRALDEDHAQRVARRLASQLCEVVYFRR